MVSITLITCCCAIVSGGARRSSKDNAKHDLNHGLKHNAPRPILHRTPTNRHATMQAPPPQQPDPSQPRATTSLLDATLLVAGTTVGAGVLALPAKTVSAGFGPSTAALCAAWAYMAASGLLIAEVNVNTLCSLERSGVSLSSMADETLGEVGALLSSVAFAFLHYALLVSYILQGSAVAAGLLASAAVVAEPPPASIAAPAFTAIVGGALLLAPGEFVEKATSVLVVGVVLSFAALVALGFPLVDVTNLAHADAAAVVPALPVMALSLVYHNVVPTICSGLGCDLPKIRTAVVAGSALPAFMFVVWNAVILGVTPLAEVAGDAFDPLVPLREAGGSFGLTVAVFSLLAVVTSFIGFCYGLTDFYADLFGLDDGASAAPSADDEPRASDEATPQPASARLLPQQAALYAMTLGPPLAFALFDPSIFYVALDSAGTYGVLTLFGVLPAAMAWVQRSDPESAAVADEALPGGRASLIAMACIALAVIGVESLERFGALS